MKELKHQIAESLSKDVFEGADNEMKSIFGKHIKLSNKLSTLFSKLGMDFRHKYDSFILNSDGRLEYTNPHLFTGSIISKIAPAMLNRVIKPSERMNFLESPESAPALDICEKPFNYMKAIYNALTHKSYTKDAVEMSLTLTDLDYTKGDFEKDCNCE